MRSGYVGQTECAKQPENATPSVGSQPENDAQPEHSAAHDAPAAPDAAPPSAPSAPSVGAHACMATLLCVWTMLILIPACLLAPPALLWQKRRYSLTLARAARRFVTFYGRVTLFFLRPWMPVQVDNRDAARRARPCIIVANHQSFLDLYLLGAQAESDLCLVSKAWPYKLLFFFAPVMRLAGYVDVESLPVDKVAEVCQRRLREGATLVFFPEGRRTRDGQLGRFYAGAFALALQAHVPVVPLIIYNSRQVFPAGGTRFCPAPVRMRMLEARRTEDTPEENPEEIGAETARADIPHRVLMRRVRDDFVRHLQAFSKESV